MPQDGQIDDDPVRRRPKDRKAKIAAASTMAFSTMGYHSVSMEDIASRVGISAPALYRHYPSKYELFRDVVLDLGQQLVDATERGGAVDDDEPQAVYAAMVDALADVSIKNRTTGGVFRWQAQHLHDEDRALLAGQFKVVHRAIQVPLRAMHPELNSTQRWTLSTVVLSIVGSITDHHTVYPDADIKSVLAHMCMAATKKAPCVLGKPATMPSSERGGVPKVAIVEYEAILQAALKLFCVNGFYPTTVEQIAAASGVSRVAIYRSFESKKAILGAVFRRAADRVSARTAEAIARSSTGEEALQALIADYVDASFELPELAYVYYADRAHLAADDLRIIMAIQHSTIDAWVEVVRAARPGITITAAKFAVHAAFSLVVDIARLVSYDNSEQSRACVRELMASTLLGDTAPNS